MALKDIFDVGKLNQEIKRLNGELSGQVKKLQDFQSTYQDYMQSAETANSMKEKHKKEIEALNLTIEALKVEHVAKLSEKDNEVTQAKENMSKDVVAKSIALVASQGTNIVIDTQSLAILSPEQAYQKLQSLTGEEKQKFYENNKPLFQQVLKAR